MKTHIRLMTIVMVLLAGLGLTACSDSGTPGTTTNDSAAMISSRSATGLQWETEWETAAARARTENKVVMVNFYADWCIWCKRLESATLSDAAVGRAVVEKCVPLYQKIDGGGRARARELGVDAPPTIVFISPEGQELGRILGYYPPTAFLERVEVILAEG